MMTSSSVPPPDALTVPVRLVFGIALVTATAVAEAARPGQGRDATPSTRSSRLAGASFGAMSTAVSSASRLARGGWGAATWTTRAIRVRRLEPSSRHIADRWNLLRRSEAERWGAKVSDLLDALLPSTVDRILDRLDLTTLVGDRIDIPAIIAGIDAETLARSLDLDPIIERIDLDALAGRVDINGLIDRVDVDAAARRVDALAIARVVVEELDLAGLIRASTTTITSETVHDLRASAADADHALTRAVDRLFHRNGHSAPISDPPASTSREDVGTP
jgi:hypothetical protein